MLVSLRLVIFSVVSIILMSGMVLSVYAAPPIWTDHNEHDPGVAQSGKPVFVPAHAIELAPGLYKLGETFDEDSASMVEGYMFLHPRTASKKPDGVGGGKPGGGNGSGDSETSSCYGAIAKGAVWKNVEDWVVDPTNTYGIADNTIFNILADGIDKWEDAADGTMDGNEEIIFGNGFSTTTGVAADTVSTDGKNEVHFGDLDDGTIGVTIVWGIFGGSPRNRVLVEWDQVYNTDYDWSAEGAGVAGKFDFDSIATHELGHAFGMADLYEPQCAAVTMYGYGETGDDQARTLEDGDINGMSNLY